MSEVTFDMWELKQWSATLGSAGPEAEAKARFAVGKTAYDGVAEAKYNAPVDTGFLMNSISAEVDGLEAEFGPTASYGIYVEHGTSRMAGQPYMGPALETVMPRFEKAMQQLGAEVLGG